MQPLIRASTLADVAHIARYMRMRDVDEVRAASGREPEPALLRSVEESARTWMAVDETGPFAIAGVADYMDDVGSPWMLATDRLRVHRKWFLSITRGIVEQMHELYPMLVNFVDARNTDSIRWLKWAGFTVDKLIPAYGYERRPFYRFHKVSPNV